MRPSSFLSRFLAVICVSLSPLLSGCDESGTSVGTADAGSDSRFWTPPVHTPLQVVAHAPDGLEVPKSTDIFVRLSGDVDPATTMNALRLEKESDHSPVDGTSTYDPTTWTFRFTPTALLAANTRYIATLAGTVADPTTHLSIDAAFTWNFQTGTSTDDTPLRVVRVVPNVSARAPLTSQISVTFSEAVTPESVTAERFVVSDLMSAIPVSGSIACVDDTCTITPNAELRANAQYSVVVSGPIMDRMRHTLIQASSTTFRTVDRAWNQRTPLSGFAPSSAVSNGPGDALILGQGASPRTGRQLVVQLFDGSIGELLEPESLATPPREFGTSPIHVTSALSDDRDICLVGGISNPAGGIAASSTLLYALVKNGSTGTWSRPFTLATIAGSSAPLARAVWDGRGHCTVVWANNGNAYSNTASRSDVLAYRLWAPTPTAVLGDTERGSVTDIDFDVVRPGHLRIATITRIGNNLPNSIYVRDYVDGTGWARDAVYVGTPGTLTTGLHHEVNSSGNAQMFWLSNARLTGDDAGFAQLWWSSRILDAGYWTEPHTVLETPLEGASIRSAGFADNGEANVNFTEYRAGPRGAFVSMDSEMFMDASQTWARAAQSISRGSVSVLFSGFDRFGAGLALARTENTNDTPDRVLAFLKLPGRDLFDFGSDRPPLWTFRTTAHITATMNRNGRVFAIVTYQVADPRAEDQIVREYRWLR